MLFSNSIHLHKLIIIACVYTKQNSSKKHNAIIVICIDDAQDKSDEDAINDVVYNQRQRLSPPPSGWDGRFDVYRKFLSQWTTLTLTC